MKRILFAAAVVAVLSFTDRLLVSAQEPAINAEQALEQIAGQQKYAFIVFHKEDGPATRTMAQLVSDQVAKRQEQAALVYVQLTNPVDKAVVDRFAMSRAPMPLTLVVAPNGAITGAFPLQVTEEQLTGAFVTPAMAGCMKSMQEGKVVFLCVQATPHPMVPQGVAEFLADPQFKDRSSVVLVQAADPAEAQLLTELEIGAGRPNMPDTVFFAPPGVLVGKFGLVSTKAEIAAALHKAGKCCDDPNCKHGHNHAASPSGSGSVR